MLSEYYSDKTAYNKIGAGRRDAILSLLGQPATVIDVGCGEGHLGETLKQKTGALVHGVDISTAAVKKAEAVLDLARVVDLDKDLPQESDGFLPTYDAIILTEVLEHLFAPEKLLRRVKEISDEKTLLIVTVPNILFWKNRLRIFFGHFEYAESGLMDRGHIHFFSWRSIQDTLRESGWEVVGTAHYCPTRGTRFLARFFPGLFAYQFVLSARNATPKN